MDNTRRAFAVSLAVSFLAVWLYFGCPPLGPGPMAEGTLANGLAKIVVIPLTLAIIAGGGLAAASALGSVTDKAATRESERRRLALTAPAGIIWIVFVAAMAFPLGLVGNVMVLGASALGVIHILRCAIALGIFQDPGPSRDCPQGGA